jgi:6-phospho-beta-glucosidase
MGNRIKIVAIGGGSSYTPELIEGFIKRYDELPITDMWLVDIEEGREHLQIIASLAQRMWDASGHKVIVHSTINRRDALAEADFVITQFRVGQLSARIKDERIPLMHGMLGQETNGAGGILKALRTIPVMKEIVSDMKELCPNAWLINFTNPSGMITEAVIKHMGWSRCIGLCNVPTISMMREPVLLGKELADLKYRFAGLNHFHWHRVFDKDGEELTDRLIEHINDENGGTPVNIYMAPIDMDLLHSMHLLPCGYHRYYYAEKDMLEHSMQELSSNSTRAEKMHEVEKNLFEIYKNPSLYRKPEELNKRGGAYYSDTACECISAIYNDKKNHMVVSTQNKGAIPCLDADSIVEISCIISNCGAEPIAWGKMRPAEKGWLQLMKAMEECTIEAAFSGNYGLALEAFTLNPLIQSGKEAKQVLDELLVAHEKHLPQFARKIEELKEKGIKSI